MIKIENKLSQPLVINLGKGRVLHLLAGGRAMIGEEDLETGEIRELIERRALAVKPMRAASPEVPDAMPPEAVAEAKEPLTPEPAETVPTVTSPEDVTVSANKPRKHKER